PVSFTGVAKKAIPAVVSIQIKTPGQSHPSMFYNGPESGDESPFDFFNDNFFQQFFNAPRRERGRRSQPEEQLQTGQASGFIVSGDGYVLTNGHVVQNATEITISLNDGREFEGKLIGTDPNTDIALVKIDATNLPYLPLGNSDDLEVGQWVVAVGNPLGLQASVTSGIVSAKGRNNLDLAQVEDFIQTDASINRGNSGGPLLNLNGEVIGMNTAIVTSMGSGGYMGIGFAIPSNLAKHIMQEIIETGSVARGFMGVSLQQISQDLAQAFGLKSTEGALVSDVTKDSPAEKAGIQQGDVILEYDEKKVNNIATLRNAVSLMKPGSNINLTVLRKGRRKNISMTVGKFSENVAQAKFKEDKLGIEVEALTPDIARNFGYSEMNGVIISNVEPRSPAAWAGIKQGTLIVAINHTEMQTIEEFHKILKEADSDKPILLLVKQGDYMHFVSIKMG
ncbi:MAG: hypothetical protein K940chlam7_00813, partial [Chlamydiae bacterium]|nr:hypothetical protein [Chlamydiota bacterium]